MPDNNGKNFESGSHSLKKVDSKKSYEERNQIADILGAGRRIAGGGSSRVKVKKKMPVFVDIIVGLLMFLLVCAVIVGSYMLFRYFSDDYDSAEITYTVTLTADSSAMGDYLVLKNKEVFMDTSANAVFFGKITAVETSEIGEDGRGQVRFTVKADAKYRSGKGYSIGDTRIAVGGKFTLRCGEKTLGELTVVELADNN